ncbi:DUF3857 domain-containing protein [Sphingosinicella terrae]|uniref:DUF3857 domain-containing protein n=1 Tax=Sphingosinicella terrae TaxID=2172047 RepID=UPI000E0DA30E|nr:DUF3857 domain-containing protein [Sphingosinicella terrae]
MLRYIFILLLVLAAAPTAARAQAEPTIAPAPDWVEARALPDPDPARRDRPGQILLVDAQTYYGPDAHEYYLEMAALVQTQQGLQGFGDIVLPWRPEQQDLIVHKVRIIRGSNVIDLLAQGQTFTVLRRENNLEAAILDGVHTAVMQAEGLLVGDVLHFAYTIRRRAGALPLRGESFFALPYGSPIERYHIRQIWPEGVTMRWRGTERMDAAQTRRTPLGTELRLDLEDAEGPLPPEGAPGRYALPTMFQITQFAGWEEISALVAPYYEEASRLSPDSTLRAEAERIAAQHAAPEARAMAALRLVQDDIRYFAVVIGDGNYLPAPAAETWSRRYGDCKAKTVMLVALLRALGIEAEPVLVSARMNDGLDQRLPQMGQFDHVIVRARIGGRSYWLDGTRTGDRSLAVLSSTTLGWGLPVRPGGAALEALPYTPPAEPLMSYAVTYDAASGFGETTPFVIETIWRGDMAIAIRTGVSQIGREEYLRQTREATLDLAGTDESITDATLDDDPEAGTFTLVVRGRLKMNWGRNPGVTSHRFRFDNSTIDWDADFERPDGPYQDAPYALSAPGFMEMVETIILPQGGRGFSIEGESFERVVAGTRLSRRLRIADGRAVSRTRFQHVAREIPAEVARASVAALREITDDSAFLIASAAVPIQTASSADEGDEASPTTASSLVEAGYRKMGAGQLEEALADFDQALTLAPDWATAHANRGIALVHLGRLDEAGAALANAMRRDQSTFVVHQGYGLLHLAQGHPEDAARSLTRSIELDPDNRYSLGRRAEAYLRLGRLDAAMADLQAILGHEPGHVGALVLKAQIHAMRDEADEAAAAFAAIPAEANSDPWLLGQRAQVMAGLGRPEEARTALAEALRALDSHAVTAGLQPYEVQAVRAQLLADAGDAEGAVNAISAALAVEPENRLLLNSRCWIRGTLNVQLDEALADCDGALRSEANAPTLDSRALVKLRLGRTEEAIADADAALALQPLQAASLYVRGVARIRSGAREAGEQDLAAARRLQFDIDSEYRRYGITP